MIGEASETKVTDPEAADVRFCCSRACSEGDIGKREVTRGGGLVTIKCDSSIRMMVWARSESVLRCSSRRSIPTFASAQFLVRKINEGCHLRLIVIDLFRVADRHNLQAFVRCACSGFQRAHAHSTRRYRLCCPKIWPFTLHFQV